MNRLDRGAEWTEILSVTLLFTAITILLAYPLSLHPATEVLPQGGDTDLMLWIFGWDTHAFLHRPWEIFDGNIYYPYDHTLAYAENLIGSAFFSAPIVWLTGNLVLAMNAAALSSCVLCGVGSYVLARRVGLSVMSSVIAGVIFAFSPPRFFRLGQIHLTTVQWLPFCLASLYGYLDSGLKRDLRWAVAFLVLQVATSGHGAALTAVSVFLLLGWRVLMGEPLRPIERLRDLGLPGVAMLAFAALFFLPYRAVQLEMGLRRSLHDAFMFAPTPESFIASPSHVDQFITGLFTTRPVIGAANVFLFPGYLTLALAAGAVLSLRGPERAAPPLRAAYWAVLSWFLEVGAIFAIVLATVAMFDNGLRIRIGTTVVFSARQPGRLWAQAAALVVLRLAMLRIAPLDVAGRWRRFMARCNRWRRWLRTDPTVFFLLFVAITTWLALGPEYGLYNRVYDWPGFSFIRVPSRFGIVALLALSILAGIGVESWTARLASRARTVIVATIAVLLVAELSAFPMTTMPYAVDVPGIDRWLNTLTKPFVVAEFPVEERFQGLYMVHSTAHWQKTVHGYSGMRPALHTALYDEMTHFPDVTVLDRLSRLGVTQIVVHANLYPLGQWPLVETQLQQRSDWLTLQHVDGEGRAYQLHHPK